MNHEGEQGGGASLLALDAGGLAWEGKPGGQQLPTLPRDTAWRTVSAQITGWLDTTALDIAIVVDVARGWTLNGRSCTALHGCDDIDLSFSPVTNLLPIRRARLAVGARASMRAAWLRFPVVMLQTLDQTYERVSELRYRYESGGGSFVVLETNAVRLVTLYPGLWQLEEAG